MVPPRHSRVHMAPSQRGACETWVQAAAWQQVEGTQSVSVV
jgi:hypothetical protein